MQIFSGVNFMSEKDGLCVTRELQQQPRLRQKSNSFNETKTTLHVQHAFWYISLPFLHDHHVTLANLKFYGRREQAVAKFSFSF